MPGCNRLMARIVARRQAAPAAVCWLRAVRSLGSHGRQHGGQRLHTVRTAPADNRRHWRDWSRSTSGVLRACWTPRGRLTRLVTIRRTPPPYAGCSGASGSLGERDREVSAVRGAALRACRRPSGRRRTPSAGARAATADRSARCASRSTGLRRDAGGRCAPMPPAPDGSDDFVRTGPRTGGEWAWSRAIIATIPSRGSADAAKPR